MARTDKRRVVNSRIEERTLTGGNVSYRVRLRHRSKTFYTLEEAISWRDSHIDTAPQPSGEIKRPQEIKKPQPAKRENLSNSELDAAIAALLWEAKQQRRDATIYRGSISFPKPITPNDLAKSLNVSQQRAHASLLRLKEKGIVMSQEKYDRAAQKTRNHWMINEGSMVRFILAEIQKEKLHKEAKV